MPEEGFLLGESEVKRVADTVRWKERTANVARPRNGGSDTTEPYPNAQMILLEPLGNGETAAAAVCEREWDRQIREIAMTGTPSDGEWSIRLNGVETDLLSWNATADDVLNALLELPGLNTGDVEVSLGRMDGYFPGVWSLSFAADVTISSLQVLNDSVTDTGFQVRSSFRRVTGAMEDVSLAEPVTEPLAAGSVCDVAMFPTFGLCVRGVECRTFEAPAAYGS